MSVRSHVPIAMKRWFWRLPDEAGRVSDGVLRVVAPALYRRRKERWEFNWQRTYWADLYREPTTKAKALEYWNTHRFLQEIRNRVSFNDATVVLDVGCGISTVLEFLPGRRYGIDPLGDHYRSVYAYPADLVIKRAYGEAIPFPDRHFDVVFCSNCIDHTEDSDRTIAEIWRVLRDQGWFILTCEVFETDLGARNAGHPYTMTEGRLLGLVRSFEMVQHWDSPWYGLRAYALGQPPSEQREHILLLRKT
jgi:SAM-dependent methyltransferase